MPRSRLPVLPSSHSSGDRDAPRLAHVSPPALGLGAADLAAGRRRGQAQALRPHLAQECTGCHRIDGIDNGIPSIAGWDAERFIDHARSTSGRRTNPVMVSVAKSLDDEQLEALAAYYGSLPKRRRARRDQMNSPALRACFQPVSGLARAEPARRLANMSAVMAGIPADALAGSSACARRRPRPAATRTPPEGSSLPSLGA